MSDDNKKETAAERLARLEAERDARAKVKAEAQQAAMVELELAAAEAYEALEAKHGDIKLVKTVCGPVIMKCPSDTQRRNFRRAQQTSVEARADAGKVLVTACVVHPSFDDFEKYTKAKPFIIDVLVEALVEFAGVVVDPKG